MDDKQEIIEVLTKAREIFRERGGARGVLLDDQDRVCAVGALNLAVTGDAENWGSSRLREEARETLGYKFDIVYINDSAQDPMPVILDIYDHAIKELENQ